MTTKPQSDLSIPDPPRAVPAHLYLRRARAMFFIGLILMVSGLMIGAVALASLSVAGADISPVSDLLLDRSHARTTATVTAKKLITSVHNNHEHPWRIEFRFEGLNGSSVAASGYTYNQELGKRLVAGDELAVEYDPAEPAHARPVGGYAAPTPPWVVLLVGGIFALQSLTGAGMFAGALTLAQRDRRLLAFGVAAEGEVLKVRCCKSISFGTKHPYDVYYRFRDQWGTDVSGRDRTYCYAWAQRLRPSGLVGIVFNPRNPRENALWLHGRELERLGGTVPALR
jgi:hypothetical protein